MAVYNNPATYGDASKDSGNRIVCLFWGEATYVNNSIGLYD